LSQKLVDELQQLMNCDHPYLNSQLSLPQLADKLGVSVHYLSQIINEQLCQNFFDFINHYRINQSKVLLKDANHKKLIFSLLQTMRASIRNQRSTPPLKNTQA
jgi:YesN/AraC family two-component response regulator